MNSPRGYRKPTKPTTTTASTTAPRLEDLSVKELRACLDEATRMRDSEMVKDPLERMQPATRTIVLLLEPLKPYNITIQGFICWAFRLHECAGLKNAQLFFARRTPKLTRYATLIDEQTETAGEFPAQPESPALCVRPGPTLCRRSRSVFLPA